MENFSDFALSEMKCLTLLKCVWVKKVKKYDKVWMVYSNLFVNIINVKYANIIHKLQCFYLTQAVDHETHLLYIRLV